MKSNILSNQLEIFSTNDLGLVAWFFYNDVRVSAVREENPKRVEMVFEVEKEKAKDLIGSWWGSDKLCSPRKYASAYKEAKSFVMNYSNNQ